MLKINQLLQQGRFRVIQPFGQNASGANYEAFDAFHNTNVVLKEISLSSDKATTDAQKETLKNSFADQARVLMRIQHPTLLKIHGYFTENDNNYLVSEAVGGNYLSETLARDKKAFSLAEVSIWAEKLLDALSYLHAFAPPIVHRNIRPENIKLTEKGEIKLVVSGLSENGKANGASLNYVPLEQIWKGLDAASRNLILHDYDEEAERNLEKSADASSDIYALGATVYELLTAQLPIDALERSIEILEGNADPLKSANEINSSVPPEISDVLMRSLEIRRERRFHSAAIMRQVWRTAFVRVRERETTRQFQPKEEILEIPAAPKYDLEAERREIEREKLKIEAEQKQLEEERRKVEQERREIEAAQLLERQKREAEQSKAAQFAEAEKIAAAKEIIETAPPEEILQTQEIATTAKEVASEISIEPKLPEVVENKEVFDSFDTPKKKSKALAAAIGAFVTLIGAGGGFWFLNSPKIVEPAQTVSTKEQSAPVVNVETATETTKTEITSEPTASPAPTAAQIVQTSMMPTGVAKPKPTLTPAPTVKIEVKKPNAASAKTPETPKKPVTVDDLINDN